MLSCVCPWSEESFYLAAILFIDNSDLLHLTELSETKDEFFGQVQDAIFG